MAQLNDLIVAGASRLLNGLGVLGSANMDSILPNITETYDLGASDKKWKTGYIKTISANDITLAILTVTNYATIGGGQAATAANTGALRVTGGLSATQNSFFAKSIITTPGNSQGIKVNAAYITAADSANGEIVLQGGHLRFGGSSWAYDQWAGLKYDHGTKTIYLGIADGTVFAANTAQSGGTLALPGVRYLTINGKEVIDAVDTWLRINEDKTFSSGTYFGQSIVRTDNQFQVGDGGNKFYANSSGNGYFSNSLGIGGTNTSYKIYTNGKVKVGDGAASTSTSTGALQVGGGVGVSGNSYFAGSITIANNILPEANNTRLLGSSSKYWKEAYITTMYGSADKVDGFHYGETAYSHSNDYTQPTANTVWYLKISTPVWNSNSETIYIRADGDNRHGTIILKTGSRQSRWFGWATNYNSTCVSGVKKVISNSDDIYIRLDSGTTSVTVRTTFSPTITVVTDSADYTDVPSEGGLFGNGIAATTFYGNLSGNVTGNVTGALTGNASTATTLRTARTLTIGNTGKTFNGNANVSWSLSEIGAVAKAGDTMTGNLTAPTYIATQKMVVGSTGLVDLTAAGTTRLYADGLAISNPTTKNDDAWIRMIGTGESDSVLEIATGDDAGGTTAEQIVVRQYGSSGLAHEIKLLDGSGNTYLKRLIMNGALDLANGTWNKAGDDAQFGDHNTAGSFAIQGLNGHTNLKMVTYGGSSYGTITWDGSQFSLSHDIKAPKVHGAVWNDYAEYRNQIEEIEPGYCVASMDDGKIYKTSEKFQPCDGIVSDTFGFSIGETKECKTPLAVAGRVLAYCAGNRDNYHAGDTVCAGPEGKVMKMTREEILMWPDRVVGIVSEIPQYKTWGTGNVKVNGRIWIKVR